MSRRVCIDIGSATHRVGSIGPSRRSGGKYGEEGKGTESGEYEFENTAFRTDSLVREAVDRGYVRNWTAAEAIWLGGLRRLSSEDAYPQLERERDEEREWTPEFDPVLVTEELFNSLRNRSKTASIFF